MRGLKQIQHEDQMKTLAVAPLVGAWIETWYMACMAVWSVVAPLVGAWIETLVFLPWHLALPSHPSWVRGLKQDLIE